MRGLRVAAYLNLAGTGLAVPAFIDAIGTGNSTLLAVACLLVGGMWGYWLAHYDRRCS